ncbi:MAG: hypothetical protein ACK5XN_22365 [Bacteroidota bacterium]|jgi:hypothetical protein
MRLSDLYPIISKALIYKSELDYISRCTLDYPKIETGGDLFGFWTHSGYPVIQYVIGPGPNANHQSTFFNQDGNYLSEIGNKLRETHGLQHIGEWHSHHQLGLAEPSGHDISTVCKAIAQYNLSNFFLVITNVRDNSSSVNGFMFNSQKGRDFDYAGWVILESHSPIRQDFDLKYQDLVYQPNTKLSSLLDLSKATLNNLEFFKPEYSSEYWLSEKSNHLVLKRIIEALGRFVVNVQVFQRNDDKSIYLEFQKDNKEYVVIFPIDFPKTNLIIIDKTENKTIEGVNWEISEDILDSSLAYIKSSLHVKDTFLSSFLNIN